MLNLTKIIATIGPTSEDETVLSQMVRAGMDAVRLNFSHGTYPQFTAIIKRVRALSKKTGRHIAIIQDLQGPKIRTGAIPEQGIAVKKGETVVLALHPNSDGNFTEVPITYRPLPKEVRPGDVILIDDGFIELSVRSVNAAKTKIQCEVKTDGVIKSHKGINVPTATLSADPLTKKDREDLAFGMAHGVDFVALSFVREAANVAELKSILKKHKSHAHIIAKIERHEALKNLEAIVKAADAVMVARGDLGVEIPAEQVPLEQKRIIHACNTHGKPVIVATQMLNSMVTYPRATRAEISDAATAIFDHADALMLSNETAVGKYPVEAVRTLADVASAVERNIRLHPHLLNLRRPEDMPAFDATCLNATKLAGDIRAKYLVAITKSGYTAREIAKYRPLIPCIVLTPYEKTAHQTAILWGATHAFVQFIAIKNPIPQIRKTLLAAGLVKRGDEIVVCNAGFGRPEKLITTTRI